MNTLWVEKTFRNIFRRKSLLGDKYYFSPSEFPVAAELEEAFPRILSEVRRLLLRYEHFPRFQDISPHQDFLSNDDRWKMFFLKGVGVRIDRNAEELPAIMEVLDRHPEVISGYLSILGPWKMLSPHEGPWSGVLRMHLGVIIPDITSCTMIVEGEKRHWFPGKVMVLDDTYMHSAVNDTDSLRVILMMDVLRPLPWLWDKVNKLILFMARHIDYVKMPLRMHKRWEEKFYSTQDERNPEVNSKEIEDKAEKLQEILVRYMEYLTPPEEEAPINNYSRQDLTLKHLTDDTDVQLIASRISAIIFKSARDSIEALCNKEVCVEAVQELADLQKQALHHQWQLEEEEAERRARLNKID